MFASGGLLSIGSSSVCPPGQAHLRPGGKLIGPRIRLATRIGPLRLPSAKLAQTGGQFLIPPDPANESSVGWEPVLSIQLASIRPRMGTGVAHARAGLRGANPKLVRVQAAGSTHGVPRDVEHCLLRGSPHLPGTRLRLSPQIIPGSGRLFDLGRLSPALPSLGAPAIALSEQHGSSGFVRMSAPGILNIDTGAPKPGAFLRRSGALPNRTPNAQAILMDVAPSPIGLPRTAFPLGAGPTNANVARTPQLLEASIAPVISPTPDAESFLPLGKRTLAMLQPQWKRPDPQRAPFAILLPSPLDSPVHMASAESGGAMEKWQLARRSWSAGTIRESGKLRIGNFLSSEAGHTLPVPITPPGESFYRTRLPSTPPVTSARQRSPFFPLIPQESVLDDRVRELAERVLDPALLQLVQIRFPDYDLAHTKPTMHRCGDWVPLDSRWQRRRRVWDRGARWKITKRVGRFPSGSLTIPERQSSGSL